jgi:selenocysteine-specific elongation factor
LIHEEFVMSHIVIGTAGHVDHGKTALIRALTGIDTDRLDEEKVRGLSIDLGFAYFDLPDGRRAGIIDVPGHERFMHNMLAGATSVDLVLLVVAADEGVMPQTRDHVEILDLLQVRGGVVVISKCDLVGDEEIEVVRMEVEELLAGTCLEGAPVVAASPLGGEGIAELKRTIAEVGRGTSRPGSCAPFRLPVDRVFTMPGFGTVVTGTTVAGRVTKNQQARILPRDRLVRIRNIQVHEQEVDAATEGQRTALNLAGVNKDDLRRGDTICDTEVTKPTRLLDGRLRLVARLAKPLRQNIRVKLHVGTDEVMARVVPLESRAMEAGSQQMVQLRLERATVAARGDRFVIRDSSGRRTLGGGIVVDAHAQRRGRRRGAHAAALRSLLSTSPSELLVSLTDLEGSISLADLALRLNVTREHLTQLLEAAVREHRLVVLGQGPEAVCLSQDAFRAGTTGLRTRLEELHARRPDEIGFSPGLVRRGWRSALGEREFKYCLEEMIRTGEISSDRGMVRLHDKGVTLTDSQRQVQRRLEHLYREGGTSPPRPDEALEGLSGSVDRGTAEKTLEAMVKLGDLVPVGSGGLLFHRESLSNAVELVTGYLEEHERITVAQARDLLGSTRKYLVPLLEHMDKMGHTIRQGDCRVLGRGA